MERNETRIYPATLFEGKKRMTVFFASESERSAYLSRWHQGPGKRRTHRHNPCHQSTLLEILNKYAAGCHDML